MKKGKQTDGQGACLWPDEKSNIGSFIRRNWPLLRVGPASCLGEPPTELLPDGEPKGSDREVGRSEPKEERALVHRCAHRCSHLNWTDQNINNELGGSHTSWRTWENSIPLIRNSTAAGCAPKLSFLFVSIGFSLKTRAAVTKELWHTTGKIAFRLQEALLNTCFVRGSVTAPC